MDLRETEFWESVAGFNWLRIVYKRRFFVKTAIYL
jgi:hypothetical protein